jgi:D-alanyl-lipoteichoic acid acyltransferase DltB (MBOAT superfamily)
MTVLDIAILACIAVIVRWLGRGRKLALLAVSALVLYWLQPHQEPVNLMFWLPTLTLFAAVMSWFVTAKRESRGWKENRGAVMVLLGVIVFVGLNRFFQFDWFLPVETPRFQWIALGILFVCGIAAMLTRLERFNRSLLMLSAVGLIGLLLLIKSPSALDWLFETVAAIRGKEAEGQSALAWLGFSYVAFRLLHTIFDRLAGRLPSVSLAEYVNYVIFFPAITAGPIDRLERFVAGLNSPLPLDAEGWVDAGRRIFMGLFKKFVLADALAWIALNETFVRDAQSTGWLWILLYAYSLRIYFDFSGYTDIAIGLGRLLGIRLPENFDSPYLKPNLTQFWNSWHITLTQWFRSYYFNPLTRAMRSSLKPVSAWIMILFSQVTTMLLIGLWHGLTVNFILWGLWHGCGLFIQNRWSELTRSRRTSQVASASSQKLLQFGGVFLTFNFVSLGWLFFALPSPEAVWSAVLKLVGVL